MNRNEITDHVGAENWKMVVSEFAGQTLEQITATLNEMFTQVDNSELAEAIYNELN
jgi:hypothetical protein